MKAWKWSKAYFVHISTGRFILKRVNYRVLNGHYENLNRSRAGMSNSMKTGMTCFLFFFLPFLVGGTFLLSVPLVAIKTHCCQVIALALSTSLICNMFSLACLLIFDTSGAPQRDTQAHNYAHRRAICSVWQIAS